MSFALPASGRTWSVVKPLRFALTRTRSSDQLQGCLLRSLGLAACHPGDTLNGFSVQKAWIGSGRGSISDDAELGGQLRPGSSPEKLTKRGNYPGHMSSVFSLQQVCVARLRAILDVGLLEITIRMNEGRQGSLDWNWCLVGRRSWIQRQQSITWLLVILLMTSARIMGWQE